MIYSYLSYSFYFISLCGTTYTLPVLPRPAARTISEALVRRRWMSSLQGIKSRNDMDLGSFQGLIFFPGELRG